MGRHAFILAALCVATTGAVACEAGGGEPPPPMLDIAQYPLPVLSDYGFFVGELGDQTPHPDVVPYTVNAPLWADGAEKGRFFVLPPGGTIGFTSQDEWAFPTGTVFIKSFFFDRDRSEAEDLQVIETRLLVRSASGEWDPHIYLWDEAQTEAELVKAGADVYVDYLDEAGQPQQQLYLVPDRNTCESCHQRDDSKLILGPTTQQLNTQWEIGGEWVNQIEAFRERGMFDGNVPPAQELPAYPHPAGDAELDPRARSYLHGNCAHCHRPGGDGGSSGLKFTFDVTDRAEYGACKVPAAAGTGAGGRSYDIVPGNPEQSIVPYRMASSDPEIKMPELPSLLPDPFGVELITAWIAAMDPVDCATGG